MSRRLTFYFFSCLLLAMLRIEAYAQTRELKGTVTDSTGSSIVGASAPAPFLVREDYQFPKFGDITKSRCSARMPTGQCRN